MAVTNEKRGWTWSRTGLLLTGAGVLMTAVGFIGGSDAQGETATAWGVLAGVGFAGIFVGLVKIWMDRAIDAEANDPGGQTKRERLQTQRSWQLWLFPVVAVFFLFQATFAMRDILGGIGEFGDYLMVLLPVLYAWLVAMIAMGWDGNTRKNRRWLEDELTLVIRAKAMTAASVVLMAGLTVSLALGLWRPEIGVMATVFALTAGGATAGIRFAWLDREAGKDG
ncbi:MAG: hypothetical protein V4701_09335 [Pseudomonadota bacterium]